MSKPQVWKPTFRAGPYVDYVTGNRRTTRSILMITSSEFFKTAVRQFLVCPLPLEGTMFAVKSLLSGYYFRLLRSVYYTIPLVAIGFPLLQPSGVVYGPFACQSLRTWKMIWTLSEPNIWLTSRSVVFVTVVPRIQPFFIPYRWCLQGISPCLWICLLCLSVTLPL